MSLITLDLRKLRYGSFDKRQDASDFLSILVLTEFSHWEDKSQRMIRTCIDDNLVVDDSLLIEAFKVFERNFGEQFLDFISKDKFRKNDDVRSLAMHLVGEYDARIFRDIEDDEYKAITYHNGLLLIS